MLLHGVALLQIDTLSVEVGSTTTINLNHIILGLGIYVFSFIRFSKQNHVMRRGMMKPIELKVRDYASRMININ